MTHEQANDPTVIKLAEPVVRVLEGLDVGCPCQAIPPQLRIEKAKERDGFRLVYQKEKRTIIPECHSCHNTGKVKWQWQPKVGEWCIVEDKRIRRKGWDERTALIARVNPSIRTISVENGLNYIIENCTPILEWEEIERILEGAGYGLDIMAIGDEGFTAEIRKRGVSFGVSKGNGKTRQKAVMRAVMRLGKESDTGNAAW